MYIFGINDICQYFKVCILTPFSFLCLPLFKYITSFVSSPPPLSCGTVGRVFVSRVKFLLSVHGWHLDLIGQRVLVTFIFRCLDYITVIFLIYEASVVLGCDDSTVTNWLRVNVHEYWSQERDGPVLNNPTICNIITSLPILLRVLFS